MEGQGGRRACGRMRSGLRDVGVAGALGYRIKKGYGMNLLVRYYQGLRDIRKEPVGDATPMRAEVL